MADEKFVTEQAFKDILEKVYDLDVAGDGVKIEVDAANKHKVISAPFDDVTVKNGANGFYVPIDNSTLVVENDVIKAKIDTEPGKGLVLENGKINANVDNVTLEVKDDNKLAVRFDGYSIFENEDVQDHLLSGHYSTAGDGIDLEEHITDKGREQKISVKVDDDSIKIVDGKLVAKDVAEVDDKTIVRVADNKLAVNFDPGSMYINYVGQLQVKPQFSQGNGIEFEALPYDISQISVAIDDNTIKTGEPEYPGGPTKLYVNLEGIADNETLIYDETDKKLKANIDNTTIVVENNKLKATIPYIPVVKPGRGTEVIKEDMGGGNFDYHVEAKIDNDTIKFTDDGELMANIQIPETDDTTIKVVDGKLHTNIDNNTITYNSEEDYIEVTGADTIFEHGVTIFEDADNLVHVQAVVDSETIYVNELGQLSANIETVDNFEAF